MFTIMYVKDLSSLFSGGIFKARTEVTGRSKSNDVIVDLYRSYLPTFCVLQKHLAISTIASFVRQYNRLFEYNGVNGCFMFLVF